MVVPDIGLARPLARAALALLLLAVTFLLGRCSKHCPEVAPPPVFEQAPEGFFRDHARPPAGTPSQPIREIRTTVPVPVRLPGACPTPSRPTPNDSAAQPSAPPPARVTEPILSVTRKAGGKVEVVRVGADERLVATEYHINARGERLGVLAQEEGRPPVVVGDRWWWLRDVEVLGGGVATEGKVRAAAGLQLPVSERVSVYGLRGPDVWMIGASFRPFARWP